MTGRVPYAAHTRHMSDDIDPTAVQRAVGGDRSVPLTHGERRAAVAALRDRGVSVTKTALILGLNKRTVERLRAETADTETVA